MNITPSIAMAVGGGLVGAVAGAVDSTAEATNIRIDNGPATLAKWGILAGGSYKVGSKVLDMVGEDVSLRMAAPFIGGAIGGLLISDVIVHAIDQD